MTRGVDTTSGSELGLPSPKERRRLREAGELSHEEVAGVIGVTPATLRSWETGRTEPRGRKREVYAEILARLAAAAAVPDADTPDLRVTAAGRPGPTRPPRPPEPHAREPEAEPAHDRATPFASWAPRAGGGVRAFANGAQARSGGPGTRPRSATKRAAKPPVGAARHDTKTPVRTGGGSSGGSGGSAPGKSADAPAPPTPAAPADASAPADSGAPADAPAEVRAPEPPAPDAGAGAGAAPPPPDPSMEPSMEPSTEPSMVPEAEEVTAVPESTEPAAAVPRPSDPVQAFEALYAYAAPALVRQAYLLTARRALAHESVERAFQQAWDRWPEVATDPDPVGWVRAAVYEYALSPWHRFRRAHRHPDKPPAEPADRILLDALLALPPVHRRTVLLYDGVGLDLPDTAAETEATTPTAGSRLLHAHADLAERVPELADVPPEKQSALLRERLGAVRPVVRLEPRSAAVVRAAGEHRGRRWIRAGLVMTALIAVATAYTTATAPREYEPPSSPGTSVSGVPPHSGPQRLTEESRELQDKLRADPAAGPARVSPGLE
ncbi:helix-turn-helix domain-containing protein [Streptomyces sp. NPDC048383]|uniref:helix-turn-helix domain-containing protein n=1 Tax=Streptomyces sp. NPDC048383 TaxID=3155386 RepID=UPI003435D2AC